MNQEKTAFKAKRVTRTFRQTIKADPFRVFSLICPVREAEWLDGWDYTMIYSESGLAEEGCVFISRNEDDPDTIWLMTKRDDEKKETEFARITPGSRAALLRVAVRGEGEKKSSVDISYTFTALSNEGNVFIENFTEKNFIADMKFWEASMNHFVETGEMLPNPNREKWLRYESD